jgi:ATP-dependent exoDNAse (exonuclease V) beta subunit
MLTTISKRVEDGAAMSRAQHDEECRIAYVGVTRARQTLTLIKETKPGGFYMEV